MINFKNHFETIYFQTCVYLGETFTVSHPSPSKQFFTDQSYSMLIVRDRGFKYSQNLMTPIIYAYNDIQEYLGLYTKIKKI